jgi:hypothetical protein
MGLKFNLLFFIIHILVKNLLFFLIGFNQIVFCCGQTSPSWEGSIGGPVTENAEAIAVDKDGYVYISGDFMDTADLDPGPGVMLLAAVGYKNMFIEKLDNSGNLMWMKQITVSHLGQINDLALDAHGNIFIVGYFDGTADFDPGPAALTLHCTDHNTFICKYDPAGNLIWAKQMEGDFSLGTGIAVGSSGSVYISGYFTGHSDADPNTGIHQLNAVGHSDIFLCKLDGAGNFVWAERFGGINYDWGWGITLDNQENVISNGEYWGTIDFDAGPGTHNLTASGFDNYILKTDSAGNFIWAVPVGGQGVATDANGNLYTTGFFDGTVDFDPGPGVYNMTAFAFYDLCVFKLDPNGNLVWAKQSQGANTGGTSIAVDYLGNSYIIGHFMSTTEIDPGSNVCVLTSEGDFDICLLTLDYAGNFVCGQSFGGTRADYGYDIAVDNKKNMYCTGTYQDSCSFSNNLISNGHYDIFIVKTSCDLLTDIPSKVQENSFKIFPNPSQGQFHLSLPEDLKNGTVYIYNILGQKIYSAVNINQETEIDLKNSSKGIYVIEVTSGNNRIQRKLVID